MSLYRQRAVARWGNQAVHDVVVFPVRLGDFPKEIGGIEFRLVNSHPASLGNHSTLNHTYGHLGWST